jgi:hypothetical protein
MLCLLTSASFNKTTIDFLESSFLPYADLGVKNCKNYTGVYLWLAQLKRNTNTLDIFVKYAP